MKTKPGVSRDDNILLSHRFQATAKICPIARDRSGTTNLPFNIDINLVTSQSIIHPIYKFLSESRNIKTVYRLQIFYCKCTCKCGAIALDGVKSWKDLFISINLLLMIFFVTNVRE